MFPSRLSSIPSCLLFYQGYSNDKSGSIHSDRSPEGVFAGVIYCGTGFEGVYPPSTSVNVAGTVQYTQPSSSHSSNASHFPSMPQVLPKAPSNTFTSTHRRGLSSRSEIPSLDQVSMWSPSILSTWSTPTIHTTSHSALHSPPFDGEAACSNALGRSIYWPEDGSSGYGLPTGSSSGPARHHKQPTLEGTCTQTRVPSPLGPAAPAGEGFHLQSLT